MSSNTGEGVVPEKIVCAKSIHDFFRNWLVYNGLHNTPYVVTTMRETLKSAHEKYIPMEEDFTPGDVLMGMVHWVPSFFGSVLFVRLNEMLRDIFLSPVGPIKRWTASTVANWVRDPRPSLL